MSGTFQPFVLDLEPTGNEGRLARENRRTAFRSAIECAISGSRLTAAELAGWHRQFFAGLSCVPDPCYLGGFRGSDHPWLRDYEVDVRGLPVAPARQVGWELERFFPELERRTQELAAEVPPGQIKGRGEARRVIELVAWAHGEWLRIHPFANGNGRTARLLANYVLARFRLRPVVRLRPRPEPPYTEAATASMRGDFAPIADWLTRLSEGSEPGGEV